MVGSCAGMAALIGTFEAAGGTLGSAFQKEAPTPSELAAHGGHGHDGENDNQYYYDLSQMKRREIKEERRRNFMKVRLLRMSNA